MKRDLFLGRVKSALRGAALPDVDGPMTAPEISFADPIERFVQAATAVDAEVVRVADPADLVAVIGECMPSPPSAPPTNGKASPGGGGYIAWDEVDAMAPGLSDHLAANGWQRIDAGVDADTRAADNDRIGSASVGITGVDLGVAATGSLVLTHGPGRPRSASLLVETHIALVRADAIVPSLSEAFARVGWDDHSNIVAITGPSRTGDIESILTLGVHGPRHLLIVVVG